MALLAQGPDWVGIAQNLGVAVMCLLGLSYAVYKATMWIGLNVLKPLADRHIKFVDEVATSMRQMADNYADLAIAMKEIKGMVIKAGSVMVMPLEAAMGIEQPKKPEEPRKGK